MTLRSVTCYKNEHDTIKIEFLMVLMDCMLNLICIEIYKSDHKMFNFVCGWEETLAQL